MTDAQTTTDQPQTVDSNSQQVLELLKALDPSVIEAIAKEKGMIVKSDSDYKKEIGQAVKVVHETWEQKLASATNQRKPDGTKGLDWLEQVLRPVEQQKQEPQMQQSQENDLIKQFSAKLAELQEQLQDEKAQTFKATVNANIESGLPEIEAPANIDKEHTQKWIETLRKSIKTSFKEDYIAEVHKDGGLIFKDLDGNYKFDNNGKPLTAAQIIKESYGYLIPKKGHQATGAGITSNGLRNNSAYLGETQEEVEKALESRGLQRNSQEYLKALKAHTELVRGK